MKKPRERTALDTFGRFIGPCVYFARIARTGEASPLKIGITRNIAPRFEFLAYFEHGDVELLGVIPGATYADEQALLKRFREHRVQGLEFFRDVPEIREFIATLPAEHRPVGLSYPDRGTRHGHPGVRRVEGCAQCDVDRRKYHAARDTRNAKELACAARSTPSLGAF